MKQLSLGEGNTPLLRLTNLEKSLNWPGQIWGKCEFLNPTGSFKDRGSLAEITQALKLGRSGVICASTGNMAASLSAYAAKTNISCFVIVPKSTPTPKLSQATTCGAKLVKVNGNYDQCVLKAKELATEKNLFLCGDYKIRRQGQASLGKELAKSKVKFDSLIIPVGNGTLGCAISQGFAKFNQPPRFVGVQGKGSDPITEAWKKNQKITPIKQPKTNASAMKVGTPLDGNMTLKWVSKTNGQMLSVSNKEMSSAQKLLAAKEGIFVELASAATVAALAKLKLSSNSNIVLILTGSGLKEGGN